MTRPTANTGAIRAKKLTINNHHAKVNSDIMARAENTGRPV